MIISLAKQNIENRQLSQWVSSQRNAFSKGLMHPVLKAKLDAINFIWSQNDYKWNEQGRIAQQIINENVQHKKAQNFPMAQVSNKCL